jgi:hypothetical protein
MPSFTPTVCTLVLLILVSCNSQPSSSPLKGTWQLLTGTVIENGDTTVTDYTNNKSFIKTINNTHFAFLGHDLGQSKDSAAIFFVAGGGKYTFTDSSYTEHLEYCNDRLWEHHDFTFTIHIHNDTLVQRGIEKVEGKGVNRLNIEKYARVGK